MDEKVLLASIKSMMTEALEPVREDLTEVKERLTGVETRLDRLEADVAVLKEDVAGLKDDMVTVKQNLADLGEAVTVVVDKIDVMDKEIREIKRDHKTFLIAAQPTIKVANDLESIRARLHVLEEIAKPSRTG